METKVQPGSLTMDQVRSEFLRRLDLSLDRLRQCVSDPEWCNTSYKEFQEALARIQECCKDVARFNSVAQEMLR